MTNHKCDDCSRNVLKMKEFSFIVNNNIWGKIGNPKFMCIECLEKRLGRKLVKKDFGWDIPMNFMGIYPRSKRLLSRMGKRKFSPMSLNELALKLHGLDSKGTTRHLA